MQGNRPAVQPALSRCPRSEDLQKLLRAVQTNPAAVHQPFNMENGRKFVLKVHQARGTTGLGRTRNASLSPIWSLCEGIDTLWEYSTSDVELIFNLVEEVAYSAAPKQPGQSAPVGGSPEAALSVLEEMSGLGAFSGRAPANVFENREGFSSTQQSYPSSQASGATETHGASPFASGSTGQFSLPKLGSTQQSIPAAPAVFATGQSMPVGPSMSQTDTNSRGMQLSGTLSDLGLCELFQSISVAGLTGRLDVSSGLESLEVYFEDGAPRRASFRSDSMTGAPREINGEEVLLEGMTWSNGFFQFNSALKSSERSPMRRLDILLMEGATLKDYLIALEKAGFSPESVPQRIKQLSEAEFEQSLSAGIPVNMDQQKNVYMAFNGKSTLADIARQANLPKSVWLPLLFNLFNCGLIGLSTPQASTPSTDSDASSPMVREAVKEAFQELLRADTGLLSYPLFMHFLEVEFQRALRLRLPFSLIIVKVHKEGAGLKEHLSSDDLKLLAGRIRDSLEPYDHVGHYQTLDIGILLPHRAAAQAEETIKKIIADFNDELAQTGNQVRFVWSTGIACIPEDGIKLSAMVSKAEQRRDAEKSADQFQPVL